MIITFLGHSSLSGYKNLIEIIKNAILQNTNIDGDILFYCGGYGDFDYLCAKACQSIKIERPNAEVIFVTPYINESYQKNILCEGLYDSMVYPPLEKVPFRFAISKRNEWMVDNADIVIAYVKNQYGGAYKSLEYAKRKKKHIINLAQIV